jgi:hypothetical protein
MWLRTARVRPVISMANAQRTKAKRVPIAGSRTSAARERKKPAKSRKNPANLIEFHSSEQQGSGESEKDRKSRVTPVRANAAVGTKGLPYGNIMVWLIEIEVEPSRVGCTPKQMTRVFLR